jgi:hypothetical protein
MKQFRLLATLWCAPPDPMIGTTSLLWKGIFTPHIASKQHGNKLRLKMSSSLFWIRIKVESTYCRCVIPLELDMTPLHVCAWPSKPTIETLKCKTSF